MNFIVLTFGCKVNHWESENIISNMKNYGYNFIPTKEFEKIDIVIINSCTVTCESDRKLRQCINRIRKTNEKSIIILTGCMPQAFPKAAKKLNIEIICGNNKKYDIPNLISKYLKTKKNIFDISDIRKETKLEEKNAPPSFNDRYRAFLKIEDGCDRFCSYCIIPYARGKVRSKTMENIKKDIQNLCDNNYKEIVLTGINLSSYGKDLNYGLDDVVREICKYEKIKRVRIGSLEPDLMSKKILLNLSKEEKFCPQFHLSLQSGNNEILKSMRRLYTREDYINLVRQIRKIFPLATFTTDIMVGFPGESEKYFNDSLSIIKEVEFLKVHAFPYSIRPGTLAAKFENQIDKSIKTKRVQKMLDISEKTSKITIEKFLNHNFNVLYESICDDGFYKGYTENYIPVKVKSDKDIRGMILKTSITLADTKICKGQLL